MGLVVAYSVFSPGYEREFIPPLALIAGSVVAGLSWQSLSVSMRSLLIVSVGGLWVVGIMWFQDPITGGWWWRQSTIQEVTAYMHEHTGSGEEVWSANPLPVLLASRQVTANTNAYSIRFAENPDDHWGTFISPREFLDMLTYDPPRYALVDGRMENHFFTPHPFFKEFLDSHYEKVAEFGTRKRRDWIEIWKLKPDTRVVWTFETGAEIESSPVVGSDGTIYTGSEDGYVYAVERTGNKKWAVKTDAPIIRSSPTIDKNGIVYIGSDDGYLYALNRDGVIRWKFKTNGFVRSSPVIGKDGIVYFGSYDKYLYAITPEGKEKWKFMTEGGILSRPRIAKDGSIYISSEDNYVHALSMEGRLKWKVKTEDRVFSSPAIASDGTVYAGSEGGVLYAIKTDGSLAWIFEAEGLVGNREKGFESSPTVGEDGTIYIGSKDYNLYAINPDGSKKWSYKTDWQIESSPTIGKDDTIYVGSEDYRLHAVSSQGKRLWVINTDGQIDSSPTIDERGILYVGSSDGKLYAIRTSS